MVDVSTSVTDLKSDKARIEVAAKMADGVGEEQLSATLTTMKEQCWKACAWTEDVSSDPCN